MKFIANVSLTQQACNWDDQNMVEVTQMFLQCTKQQIEPLCQIEDGVTPLHTSCKSGCLNTFKFLTEEIEKYKPMKDLMPSLTTKNKNTPLHFAALNGHIAILCLWSKM